MYHREYLIWKHFLLNEEKDFAEQMGYGKKEIKKIGFRKFLKAFDWTSLQHVGKWRTNVLNIIICPECKNEFGVLDDYLGLCDSCKKKFNIDKFYEEVDAVVATPENKSSLRHRAVSMFLLDEKFRSLFLKDGNNGGNRQTT